MSDVKVECVTDNSLVEWYVWVEEEEEGEFPLLEKEKEEEEGSCTLYIE